MRMRIKTTLLSIEDKEFLKRLIFISFEVKNAEGVDIVLH